MNQFHCSGANESDTRCNGKAKQPLKQNGLGVWFGPAVTWGELDTAVEGHQPSSRTGICSFVWGGTGGALPEPYKRTSSRVPVCMFLTKPSETDTMRWHEGPTASSGTCAHSPAPCSSIGIRQRAPEVAGPPLAAVLFTYASRFTLSTSDRREGVWRRCGERYAACNIIQHERLGIGSAMVWWGLSLEGRTDLHVRRDLNPIEHPPSTATHCPGAHWCCDPGLGGDPPGHHP